MGFPFRPAQPPAQQPAQQPPAQQPAPAADAQPAPEQAAQSIWGFDENLGPTLYGVPLFDVNNPFGGYGIGVLVGIDPAAQHEVGQRRMIPDTDPPQYESIEPSGGAAYYSDLLGSHGWSVALNPKAGG